MNVESAEDRVLRILALSLGVGSMIFTLLGLGDIRTQAPYLCVGYLITLGILYFGLPLVIAALSFLAPVRVLRWLAAVHAVSALGFLVFWDAALVAGGLPGSPEPFLLTIISVATSAAALVLSFPLAWAYLMVVASVSFAVRVLGYVQNPRDYSLAFQDALLIAMFSGVMTTLIQLALAAGRGQDAAARATREAAASSKAAEALDRQRTRYHAFTHDDVLATLNSAVHNAPDAQFAVRASARHALAKMDDFREGTISRRFHSAAEVESLLRGAAISAGATLDEIEVSGACATPNVPVEVPVEVSDALAEALAEAVRNSVRHAGWPDGRAVQREIGIELSPTGVRISVVDDGVGFVSRRVAPDRLGVRISILQRMTSVPGGFASVSSVRGRGTTVTIAWTAAKGSV
ncbi:MAG: hypothetical protein QM635_00010 [Microbacteriaceae bacterium]